MTLYRVGNVDADAEAHTVFLLERIAVAIERLADAIALLPVAPYTAAVSAALDVATDTGDPDADALLDDALDALNARTK